eukprot:272165_1
MEPETRRKTIISSWLRTVNVNETFPHDVIKIIIKYATFPLNVWCIGANIGGCCGLGDDRMCSTLTECNWNIKVKEIFVGDDHTVIKDIHNQYYSCGVNPQHNCGVQSKQHYILTPTQMHWMEHKDLVIQNCFMSSYGHYCTPFWKTSNGDIYAHGRNTAGRLGFDFNFEEVAHNIEYLKDKNIVKIVSGEYVSIAISEDGQVYSTGDDANSMGSNGHGLDGRKNTKWKQIDPLKHVQILDASSGYHWTVFVSSEGKVLTCGRGGSGQLGYKQHYKRKREYALPPKEIPFFANNMIRIQSVECGYNHCMAIDVSNNVYGWGSNQRGECGIAEFYGNTIWKPTLIKTFTNNIERVMCAVNSSLFKTKDCGYYVCGCNEYYQCGTDNKKDKKQPERINEWIAQNINGEEIVDVMMGGRHLFVLSN